MTPVVFRKSGEGPAKRWAVKNAGARRNIRVTTLEAWRRDESILPHTWPGNDGRVAASMGKNGIYFQEAAQRGP
jgi:hypothetical protein